MPDIRDRGMWSGVGAVTIVIPWLMACQGSVDSSDEIASARQQIRFGSSGAVDYVNASAKARAWGDSVGLLVRKGSGGPLDDDCTSGPCTLTPGLSSICAPDPWSEEQSVYAPESGTAVLVGPDLFLSAGHVLTPTRCPNYAVLMSWRTSASQPDGESDYDPMTDVYNCVEVVAHGGRVEKDTPACAENPSLSWPQCNYRDFGNDWVIFRVNDVVTYPDAITQRPTLPIGLVNQWQWPYQPLVGIHYPTGIHMQIDETANWLGIYDGFRTFQADVDIAPGSSGGPIIGADNGLVRGLILNKPSLQDGQSEIDPPNGTDGCFEMTHCAEDGTDCYGSRILDVAQLTVPPPSGMPFQWQYGMSLGIQTSFDGDLLPDSFIYELNPPLLPFYPTPYLRAYAIPSSTGIPTPDIYIPLLGVPTPAVALGDFNGDGVDDLLTGFDGLSQLAMGMSNILAAGFDLTSYLASFVAGTLFDAGDDIVGLVSGDFNQDGFDDVRAYESGGDYRLFLGSIDGLIPVDNVEREYVAIVLDQSGSMTLDQRWNAAIGAASGWVALDRATPAIPRAYSIWTLRNGVGQSGLSRVWPVAGGEGCEPDPVTGFCLFSGQDAEYQELLLALNQIEVPVVGPTTPLADGLCDVLENLKGIANSRARVILESDGNENASTGLCQGGSMEDFEGIDKSVADWGFPAESWGLNVMRAAVHFDMELASALQEPLLPNSIYPMEYVTWNVDVHYEISDPDAGAGGSDGGGYSFGGELALFEALGTATPQSSFREFTYDNDTVYGRYHAIAGDLDDGGCVDQADLSMLLQGDVWMHQAVEPNQLAIRSDLNRDGWVNYADVTVLLASWSDGCQNPVQDPSFGSVLPPSTAHCNDGMISGDESDIDCGGSCGGCPTGGSCGLNTDCTIGLCEGGTCGPEDSFNACECSPGKCGDCSGPIATCAATNGCRALVACVFDNSCSFPHETCNDGASCFDIIGFAQSSSAGQAANGVISCLGGC